MFNHVFMRVLNCGYICRVAVIPKYMHWGIHVWRVFSYCFLCVIYWRNYWAEMKSSASTLTTYHCRSNSYHIWENVCMPPYCNRTNQIIRAQVQKQVPKHSNFRTWTHIIPVVNWNHEGFQTNSLTTKIASFNITHHTLYFTSSSEINLHHGVAIITNQVYKVAEA
jgi:hypothetical protein